MAARLPKRIVSTLNELTWIKTAENHFYHEVEGREVELPRPEGKVWFAWTGHDEAQQLAAALKGSPAQIDAQMDFVGDVFGVSVPPSQIPALARCGVEFAKMAEQDPAISRIEPLPRVFVRG